MQYCSLQVSISGESLALHTNGCSSYQPRDAKPDNSATVDARHFWGCGLWTEEKHTPKSVPWPWTACHPLQADTAGKFSRLRQGLRPNFQDTCKKSIDKTNNIFGATLLWGETQTKRKHCRFLCTSAKSLRPMCDIRGTCQGQYPCWYENSQPAQVASVRSSVNEIPIQGRARASWQRQVWSEPYFAQDGQQVPWRWPHNCMRNANRVIAKRAANPPKRAMLLEPRPSLRWKTVRLRLRLRSGLLAAKISANRTRIREDLSRLRQHVQLGMHKCELLGMACSRDTDGISFCFQHSVYTPRTPSPHFTPPKKAHHLQ